MQAFILAIVLLLTQTLAHADETSEQFNITSAIEVLTPEAEANLAYDTSTFPCVQNGSCYIFDGNYIKGVVPVPANEALKFRGKGLSGKKSKQILGLACLDETPSCEVMRFVYVVSSKEAYFMGPKFKVKDEKALNKLLKNFTADPTLRYTRGGLTLLGGLLVCFGLVAVAQITWPFLILFGLGVTAYMNNGDAGTPFDIYQPAKNALIGSDGIQFVNQDGWNWSTKARQMREKSFRKLIYQFQYMNGFFSENTHLYQEVR